MLLNGKKLADKILDEIKERDKGNYKKLVIVTYDKDDASQVYIKNKKRACERANVPCEIIVMKETDTDLDYTSLFYNLSLDDSVGGIILQLPAAPGIDVDFVTKYISDDKDVDGFKLTSKYKPCTPSGIMTLIKHYNGEKWLEGKNALVIGRSKIVGKPMADLLLEANANVTICHSKTKKNDLSIYLSICDIVVSAVGKYNFLDWSDLDLDATIIDVGMNRNVFGELCGDLKEDCPKGAFRVTPVPGGVGPMTVATLVKRVSEK